MVTKSIYPKWNRKGETLLVLACLLLVCPASSPLLAQAQQHRHNLTSHQQHHIPQGCSGKNTMKIQGEVKDLKSFLHSHFFCFLSLFLPCSISLHSYLPVKFTKMLFLLTRAWLLQNLTEHLESCSPRSRHWVRAHEEMIKKCTFWKEKALTKETQTITTEHSKENQDEAKKLLTDSVRASGMCHI